MRQVSDRIWVVTFMDYDSSGIFDDETCRLEPSANPFGPKVLPMSPEISVTHVTGMDLRIWRPHWDSNPGFSLERAAS